MFKMLGIHETMLLIEYRNTTAELLGAELSTRRLHFSPQLSVSTTYTIPYKIIIPFKFKIKNIFS